MALSMAQINASQDVTFRFRRTGGGRWGIPGPVSQMKAGVSLVVSTKEGDRIVEIASVGKTYIQDGEPWCYGYAKSDLSKEEKKAKKLAKGQVAYAY